MVPFLKQDQQQNALKNTEKYSRLGLRTLVLAQTTIEESEYKQWKQSYQEALASMQNREEKVDSVINKLEKDMQFLGVNF